MRAIAAFALLCAGCGRIGFDALFADAHGPGPMRVAADVGPPVYPPPSVTVTVPTDVMPGDLMLLAMYLNQPGATITPPSAWQTVFDQLDTTALFRASFFERRAVVGEPTSYDFPVASSNLAAWALVVYRDAAAPADDQAMLVSGTPSAGYVTYTVPSLAVPAASNEVVLLLIDDSGSTTAGATPWTSPPGMSVVVDGSRVAIVAGPVAGPGSPMLAATVSVPNTTVPHGAVRAITWAE